MTKLLGGAFLVVGTTIGAGMLSLPLITAACGLWVAILLIIVAWSVMYSTGLRLIQVCSNKPLGVNFASLIKEEMPKSFQVVFTTVYLLLLYALMAAYATQGSSLISLVSQRQVPTVSIDAIVFILIFGLVILSTRLSDYVNRSFVSVKLILYVLCVISMLFAFKWANILDMPLSFYALVFAWPTLLPSFGFQNIIPVLYEYQKGDVEAVKRSIFFGSVIVLIIYIIWLVVCLAILPQKGIHSYEAIFKEGNTLRGLINEIKKATDSPTISILLSVFINISIITSFICVGLSLYHYIRDTFRRFGIEIHKFVGFVLTFFPPFLYTVFYPKGFILVLQYAAIFAVIVFVFTPVYLDKENRANKHNLYPLILGTLVIVAQILNLSGVCKPF